MGDLVLALPHHLDGRAVAILDVVLAGLRCFRRVSPVHGSMSMWDVPASPARHFPASGIVSKSG